MKNYNKSCTWDWYVTKNILAYPKQDIIQLDIFPSKFDVIKDLLENNLVFRFDFLNDIKYLVNDCKRYGLEYPQFKYIDVRDMISILENRKSTGLGVEYFNFTCKLAIGQHRSDNDAFYTKEIVRVLILKYVKDEIAHGKKIDIISFNEFIKQLSLPVVA